MNFKEKILVFILLVGNLLRVGRPYKLSKKKRYFLHSLDHLYPARTEVTVSYSASIYTCILYSVCYACLNLPFICTIAECTSLLPLFCSYSMHANFSKSILHQAGFDIFGGGIQVIVCIFLWR